MKAVFKFALVMSAIPLLTAQKVERFPLSSLEGLEPQHLKAEPVRYRGRDAIHLSATPETKGEPIVILTNSDSRLRIVVSGVQAKLYINGADQPSLVVNDLKLGRVRGKVALWSGRDADGYFSNLRVY
jgi:hypothetical protein